VDDGWMMGGWMVEERHLPF